MAAPCSMSVVCQWECHRTGLRSATLYDSLTGVVSCLSGSCELSSGLMGHLKSSSQGLVGGITGASSPSSSCSVSVLTVVMLELEGCDVVSWDSMKHSSHDMWILHDSPW